MSAWPSGRTRPIVVRRPPSARHSRWPLPPGPCRPCSRSTCGSRPGGRGPRPRKRRTASSSLEADRSIELQEGSPLELLLERGRQAPSAGGGSELAGPRVDAVRTVEVIGGAREEFLTDPAHRFEVDEISGGCDDDLTCAIGGGTRAGGRPGWTDRPRRKAPGGGGGGGDGPGHLSACGAHPSPGPRPHPAGAPRPPPA